jgi:hypothetical protein
VPVATFVALVAQACLRFGSPGEIPPEVEIVAWSLAYGVSPHVALAVAQAETGPLPERQGVRDRVISKGNYGRFQIRCRTWKRIFDLSDCRDFLDRHVNIRAGVAVLAYKQALFNGGRIGGPPTWVGHYNEGVLVTAGGNGERFTRAVIGNIRRARIASERRWGTFKGW